MPGVSPGAPGPGPWSRGLAGGLGSWRLWPLCFHLDYSGPGWVSMCGQGGVEHKGQRSNPFLGHFPNPGLKNLGSSLPSSQPLLSLQLWPSRGTSLQDRWQVLRDLGTLVFPAYPFLLSLYFQELMGLKVRLAGRSGRGKEEGTWIQIPLECLMSACTHRSSLCRAVLPAYVVFYESLPPQ